MVASRVRALRRFTVRPGLPEPLADLRTLATNLRWTWHPPTQELFAAVDPTVWSRVENDPLRLLSEVPADVLDRLAADEAFLAKVKAVAADLRHYLTGPRWYQQRSEDTTAAGQDLCEQRPPGQGARFDRVLLHGVRRHRGPAQLLRWPRRARR